jgi:hypothetical protein
MEKFQDQMLQFVKDEGYQTAMQKLENWRDCLEEMQEILSLPEKASCQILLAAVTETIKHLQFTFARDQFLKETEFVVEATHNESHLLWEKFCTQSMYKTELNKYNWEQINPGYLICVGDFHGFPVNISCFWYRINGVMVMFYEDVSRIVDHEMIKEWLKKNCAPRWDKGTRLAHTNATNFHNVLGHIRELGKG